MRRGRLDVTDAGDARGSATVWMLMLAAVVCAVAVSIMLVGQARVARHRAGTAADLAALAAAGSAAAGRTDDGAACERAAAVARRNGGRIVRCAARGEVVDVVVEVPLGRLGTLLDRRAVRARARAGPGGYESRPSAPERPR